MRLRTLVLAAAVAAASVTSSFGAPVSIKLNTTALGLGIGNVDYNGGMSVDPDIAGKIITSATTGVGSILTVQKSGVAGPGSVADPLLATITARTHLDTVSGLPALHDFQAGVLFISKQEAQSPKDEGLGVRAFMVDETTGLRTFHTMGPMATGRARIEGSKEVSGGTGPTSGLDNGPPHVDEDVIFDINTALALQAKSFSVLLTKFEDNDRIDLTIERLVGAPITLTFQGTSNTSLFEEVGTDDKVWKVNFSGVPGLLDDDIIKSFTIRAVDNNPSMPRGTAEHFLINGFAFDDTPVLEQGPLVPEPAVAGVMVLGAGWFLMRRRRA
jgi:hypothetical protein